MLKKIKTKIIEWIVDWNTLRKKDREDCTIEELKRKTNQAKLWSYTFIMNALILMGMMLELYIVEDKSHNVINILLVLQFIALSNEVRNRQNLQLFIYQKKMERYNDRAVNLLVEVLGKNNLIEEVKI